MIKLILNFFKKPIDFFLGMLIIPSSLFFYVYRYFGSKKFFFTTKVLKKIGIFPIKNHYHEPQFFFSKKEEAKILQKFRKLPGLNMQKTNQINLLRKLQFSEELINLDLEKFSINYNFSINNNFFEAGDAELYYQIIRQFKPKKIIEIGSGHSTKIAMEAILQNNKFKKNKTKLICVEPFENKFLRKLKVNLIEKKIEDINLNFKKELKANDILFIDSSHIIKPDGDILKIFLDILPQLNKGVIIHFHDIFTPKNYPAKFLFEDIFFWNEQYILESVLSLTNRLEILLAVNFLKNNYFHELKKVCPYLKKKNEPSSFYLKVL